MIGIALGATSFLVVFWVDAASLKGMGHLKPILWLASIALFASGLLLSLNDPDRLPIPAPLVVVGWVLSILFAMLTVYSLFVEIPFLSAYVRKGRPSKVVSRGTYALCRHPGVLWLSGFLLALVLAHGSLWLLLAVPVWIGLDILYVVLQERLFFVRMFGAEYLAYQRSVPMLLPTARSVRECARTIFRRE